MAINEALLNILVCPVCKGALENESGQALTCHTCQLRYPIREDIPIMLVDEAEKLG